MGLKNMGYNYDYLSINNIIMVGDNFIEGYPVLSRIVGSLLTALMTLTIAWLTFGWESDESFKKELEMKASRKELKEVRTEVFKYTDDEIIKHSKADEARYQGIKDMFNLIKEDLKEIKQDIRQIRE